MLDSFLIPQSKNNTSKEGNQFLKWLSFLNFDENPAQALNGFSNDLRDANTQYQQNKLLTEEKNQDSVLVLLANTFEDIGKLISSNSGGLLSETASEELGKKNMRTLVTQLKLSLDLLLDEYFIGNKSASNLRNNLVDLLKRMDEIGHD